MRTTIIVVELLIVGAEFAALLLLVGALYFGVPPSLLKLPANAVHATMLVSVVYPLGIAWSRVCDLLCSFFDRRMKERTFEWRGDDLDKAYRTTLIRVLAGSSTLADGLAQARSQFRIARATGVSSLLAALTVLVATFGKQLCAWNATQKSGLIVLLVALGVISMQAWYHLRSHHLRWIRDAGTVLPPDPSND